MIRRDVLRSLLGVPVVARMLGTAPPVVAPPAEPIVAPPAPPSSETWSYIASGAYKVDQ